MPRAGGGVHRKGVASPPPYQLWGLGEHCKLFQRGPGRSPGYPSGFLHFIDARWLFLASRYIAKKFSSQHFVGGEPVTPPPLNTALNKVSGFGYCI